MCVSVMCGLLFVMCRILPGPHSGRVWCSTLAPLVSDSLIVAFVPVDRALLRQRTGRCGSDSAVQAGADPPPPLAPATAYQTAIR